jgi:hypothetical protein
MDSCLCARTARAGFLSLPVCHYATGVVTGLQEGSPHEEYAGFDKRDIVWARRVSFHDEQSVSYA